MDATPQDEQGPATLEESAIDLLDVVDGVTDDLDVLGPPLGELRAALKRRLDLLDGTYPDRALRAGLALTRLGRFAQRIGALRQDAAVGDEGTELSDGDLDYVDVDLEAVRDRVARDLVFALNDAGDYGDLSTLERAKAIRELAEAYTRLGGEVRAAGVLAPQPLEPIREVNDLVASIWRRLNAAGKLSTSDIDDVAVVVRTELEAPATAEHRAG